MLLLHGFPQTSRCWAAQLDALAAASHRAVAVDQRGFLPVPARRPRRLRHGPSGRRRARHRRRTRHRPGRPGRPRPRRRGGVDRRRPPPGQGPHAHHRLVAPPPGVRPCLPGAGRNGRPGTRRRGSARPEPAPGYIRAFREAPRGQIEDQLLPTARPAAPGLCRPSPTPRSTPTSTCRPPAPSSPRSTGTERCRPRPAQPSHPAPSPRSTSGATPTLATGRAAAEATEHYVTGPYDFVAPEGVSHWIPRRPPPPHAPPPRPPRRHAPALSGPPDGPRRSG